MMYNGRGWNKPKLKAQKKCIRCKDLFAVSLAMKSIEDYICEGCLFDLKAGLSK